MSRTREFRRGDAVTVITESGRDEGPTFVLVHGIGMGDRYFSDLADSLARVGRVLALDLPGFGEAPEPRHPQTMSESGEYLAELIAAEGLDDPVVLVGHSMGTQIVAETAAQRPDLVASLVLIAPTVNPRERSAVVQAIRLLEDPSLTRPKVVVLAIRMYLQAGPRWYFKKLHQMLAHRIELVLPDVAAPTLVVRGEHDRLAPRPWAEEVALILPHGRYVEVADRGHETMVTAGDRVAELIAAHVRGDEVGRVVERVSPPVRSSRIEKAWWWAGDYVYAGWRQLAIIGEGWNPPARWRTGDPSRPEVVMLPGIYEHWSFLRPLGDAVNREGYRVRVVHGLGTNRRGIADTARRLGRALARVPVPPAGRVLVAHSKGGLIAKHLLVAEADGATPSSGRGLVGLVAICTPFAGSRMARLLIDPSVRALLPSDETIVMLGRASSVNARIVSVFGRFDPHIPDGSLLDGATNIRVPVAGHFRVLGAPETHRAVLEGIERLTLAAVDASAIEQAAPE
ncbi:alpha/beta fold hydrolase [Agromyces aurantiacus]|uniref:Alpha/beta fold hydrolase n=1 Tax=Agromyces aurantiacus TaxID=165814 RepID=A0ABV9R469_9MICO|nr:alpha/beta hydrolase [Agromyces aurantiacus]MBM7503052.1 pimeloyl-ACP methyl ester carboxylesterase [Agromyces aurantiacus]